MESYLGYALTLVLVVAGLVAVIRVQRRHRRTQARRRQKRAEALAHAGFGPIAERSGALALDDQPEFADAFKAYGDDESAIRRLVAGPFGAQLLEQKATVLSGRGEWLLISFNVGLAGMSEESELEHGLLAPEQTVQLVNWGRALVDTLSRRE